MLSETLNLFGICCQQGHELPRVQKNTAVKVWQEISDFLKTGSWKSLCRVWWPGIWTGSHKPTCRNINLKLNKLIVIKLQLEQFLEWLCRDCERLPCPNVSCHELFLFAKLLSKHARLWKVCSQHKEDHLGLAFRSWWLRTNELSPSVTTFVVWVGGDPFGQAGFQMHSECALMARLPHSVSTWFAWFHQFTSILNGMKVWIVSRDYLECKKPIMLVGMQFPRFVESDFRIPKILLSCGQRFCCHAQIVSRHKHFWKILFWKSKFQA